MPNVTNTNDLFILCCDIHGFGNIIYPDTDESFFEAFHFDKDVAKGIFDKLQASNELFVECDMDGNHFAFCPPYDGTGVFALAKRIPLEINYDTIEANTYALHKLLNFKSFCTSSLSSSSPYVLSTCGISLFLAFIKAADPNGGEISVDICDNYSVIRATIDAENVSSKTLVTLSEIMDAQNLNFAFCKINGKYKIAFLPYCVDDGAFGVKSTIEILKFL